MKNIAKKWLLTVIASTVGITVHADNTQKLGLTHPISEQNTPAIYNYPAAIDIQDPWGFYLKMNFLYWQAKEDLKPARKNPTNQQSSASKILEMDYKYKPGFKAALGATFAHDAWDTCASYTRLHLKNEISESATKKYSSFTPLWLSDNNLNSNEARHVKSHWKLYLDLIDLQVGRSGYGGKKVICKPYIGLRGGWIGQHFKAYYYPLTQITHDDRVPASAKSKSWLIGPRMGIDSDWLLGCGWKICANAAASLFYQSLKTSLRENEWEDNTTLYLYARNKVIQLTPNFDLGLGFGWGGCFCQNNWYLSFRTSYDFQYFWNQNIMRYQKDKTRSLPIVVDPSQGNLMLHGLTIAAKIEF